VRLSSNSFSKPATVCERIEHLFEHMFEDMVDHLLNYCNVIIPIPSKESAYTQLCGSLIRVFNILCTGEAIFAMLKDESTKESAFLARIDMNFVYAAMWSLGAVTDEEGIIKFVQAMREEAIKGKAIIEKQKDNAKAKRPRPGAKAREFRIDKRNLIPEI
jgi:hypothetical protein